MASKKIAAKAAAENPEWTPADFAKARRGSEVLAGLGIPVPKGRGRPSVETPKKQVTLRLDAKVVDHFKAGGPGWQTRINNTLATSVGRSVATGRLARSEGKAVPASRKNRG